MTLNNPGWHSDDFLNDKNLQNWTLIKVVNCVRNNFQRLLIELDQFVSNGFFKWSSDTDWSQISLYHLLNFKIDFIRLKENIVFFRNNKELVIRQLIWNCDYLDFNSSVFEYLWIDKDILNNKDVEENYFLNYFLNEFKLASYKFIYNLKKFWKISDFEFKEIFYYIFWFENIGTEDDSEKYHYQDKIYWFFYPDNISDFHLKTGIPILEYDFRTICHFISIIRDYDTPNLCTWFSNIDYLKTFLHWDLNPKTNYPRIKSFLSINKPHLRWNEIILELDRLLIDNFWEEEWIKIWNDIFKKYSRIVDILDMESIIIKEYFYWKKSSLLFNRNDFSKIILDNANKFLEKILKLLKTSWDKKEILQEIENTKSTLSQYWSLFVTSEKDDIKCIEDIQKLWIKLVEVNWDKMNKKQKNEVRNLYESNYEDFEQKNDLLPYIASWLEKDYKNSKTHFSLFYLQDICLLTYKFVEESDSRVYAWAFNAVDQMKFTKFWKFAFERKLVEFKDYEIHWHVLAWNDNLLEYYMKFWFEPDKNEDWTYKIEKLGKLDVIHIVIPIWWLKVDL